MLIFLFTEMAFSKVIPEREARESLENFIAHDVKKSDGLAYVSIEDWKDTIHGTMPWSGSETMFQIWEIFQEKNPDVEIVNIHPKFSSRGIELGAYIVYKKKFLSLSSR